MGIGGASSGVIVDGSDNAAATVIQGAILYATAQTGNFTLTLPANTIIDSIFITETAGNAITGGIKIGSTNGGTDVATAITVGASSIQVVPASSIIKQVFSTSVAQILYFQAVSAWNNASINVEVIYLNL